jgi:hypothetical protein
VGGSELIEKLAQNFECAFGMNLDVVRDLACRFLCAIVKVLAERCATGDNLDRETWDVVDNSHDVLLPRCGVGVRWSGG